MDRVGIPLFEDLIQHNMLNLLVLYLINITAIILH